MRTYTKTKWGLMAALAIGLTMTACKDKAPRELNESESASETAHGHEAVSYTHLTLPTNREV